MSNFEMSKSNMQENNLNSDDNKKNDMENININLNEKKEELIQSISNYFIFLYSFI